MLKSVVKGMIQVAIVEDEEADRAHLVDCLNYLAGQENVQFEITQFPTGLAFLGNYKPVFDIVLMDIEMPGMDGMETAKALRKLDTSVILVFVTSLAQYAIKGYDVDALNFMVKPVNKFDFAMKMSRAVARTTKRLDGSVQIKTDRETYTIRTADIKYLDVSGHYVVYHTTGGDLVEYTTLKNAEEKINQECFVRCNRCYLVNLRYVTAVKNDTVYIRNDTLKISRPQKKTFLGAFSKYMGGVD